MWEDGVLSPVALTEAQRVRITLDLAGQHLLAIFFAAGKVLADIAAREGLRAINPAA